MKKEIVYVTFNDSPGGIYKSQVIDVVKLYQENGINSNLIAFISLRNFFKDRKKIKSYLPKSRIFPSFPKLRFWKFNKFWFIFLKFNSATVVIARNVFAFNLFLEKKLKLKRLIYDGRGAVYAEHLEYDIYNGTGIEKSIYNLERKAVKFSDYRIAVSSKLVDYWVQNYGYIPGNEVVIPCTVSSYFHYERNENRISEIKNSLGIKENDIVLIYSGSIAEWQSLKFIEDLIRNLFERNKNLKLIFLSKNHNSIKKLKNEYPDRIFQLFVPHKEVPSYLDVAHFGILVRKKSTTNKVSSPVKCAEYLSRGLKVIISSGIGDYSEQILLNDLGFVVKDQKKLPRLTSVDLRKDYQKKYAIKNLTKSSELILNNYLSLLEI